MVWFLSKNLSVKVSPRVRGAESPSSVRSYELLRAILAETQKGAIMTIQEMGEVFQRRPDILDLCVAYVEARERNPHVFPIIIKIMQDMRKMDEEKRSERTL